MAILEDVIRILRVLLNIASSVPDGVMILLTKLQMIESPEMIALTGHQRLVKVLFNSHIFNNHFVESSHKSNGNDKFLLMTTSIF